MILVEILRVNMDSYFVPRFTIGMYVIDFGTSEHDCYHLPSRWKVHRDFIIAPLGQKSLTHVCNTTTTRFGAGSREKNHCSHGTQFCFVASLHKRNSGCQKGLPKVSYTFRKKT